MRVVLDTNVLLSGIFTRGICEALLDACIGSETITIVLSEHILAEFSRHASGKFKAPTAELTRAINFLRENVHVVEPAPLPRGAFADPDDLPVLGTALAALADCLVTGDAELLAMGNFRGIPIISPRALHQRLV